MLFLNTGGVIRLAGLEKKGLLSKVVVPFSCVENNIKYRPYADIFV